MCPSLDRTCFAQVKAMGGAREGCARVGARVLNMQAPDLVQQTQTTDRIAHILRRFAVFGR
jgi:hypothetical protein